MEATNMKVRDLLTKDFIDFEICDNYTEELYISYCGGLLKPAGEEKFKDVLELPLAWYEKDDGAVIEIDRPDRSEEECERLLELAKQLFYGFAGYCSEKFYEKYFI